jgi:ABC-2 type transport system permease protein
VNGFATVRMIAGRELSTRLRSKMFTITTLVMVVVIVGMSVLFKVLGSDDPTKIGVLDSALDRPLAVAAQTVGEKVATSRVPSVAEGEKKVRDGSLDAVVTGDPVRVIVKRDLDDGLSNALNVLVRQNALNAELARAGADPAAVQEQVASAKVEVTSLLGSDDQKGQRIVVSMVVAFLLYLLVFVTGLQVAQGVVEEKSSRIVEILLSAVKPWQLMFGKVLGIGLVGLIQLTVITVTGVASAVATDVLDIPTGDLYGTALWGIVWFVVGFPLYALLFAASAALVSRQEEVGGVTWPLQMLILIPYIMAFSVVPSDPDSTVVRVLSFLPFWAPVLLPVRAAFGAPLLDQFVGLAIALLTVAAMVWLAGRVYQNSVLRTGSRIKITDALRSAK